MVHHNNAQCSITAKMKDIVSVSVFARGEQGQIETHRYDESRTFHNFYEEITTTTYCEHQELCFVCTI